MRNEKNKSNSKIGVQKKSWSVMGIAFYPTNLIRVKTLNNTLIAIKSHAFECVRMCALCFIQKSQSLFLPLGRAAHITIFRSTALNLICAATRQLCCLDFVVLFSMPLPSLSSSMCAMCRSIILSIVSHSIGNISAAATSAAAATVCTCI